MPLSSLILNYEPGRRDQFLAALGGLPEVTLLRDAGHAVAVLLEAPDRDHEFDVAERLPKLPGCTGVELVLHVPDEDALVTQSAGPSPATTPLVP